MPKCINLRLAALLIICICSGINSKASHLIGDEFTYVFLDSTGGTYHYRIFMNLYEDCLAGEPGAIAEDNPANIAVYKGTTLVETDPVLFSTSSYVPGISSGPCGVGGVPLCILKKTFIKDYHLPASATGYTIVYQRCCKNTALTNVVDPGNNGSTYICTIPPTGVARYNNCAAFTNYPPEVIGVNIPFVFDCSASDTDGDSLSYELCSGYSGGSSSMTLPIPASPPPYANVNYTPPLSATNPVTCSVPMAIDPVTGVLSCTPSLVGRYLVAVCCHEWRHGVEINTSRREFELAVQALAPGVFHPSAGDDSVVYVGDTIQFNASHGATYLWSPGTFLSSTTIQNPVGRFTSPGIIHYVLRETSDSGCVGYDTVTITVVRRSEMVVPNAFSPNGDGVNDVLYPISVKMSTLVSFKVYSRIGECLYSGTGPGCGWDGTYKGVKQGMGTYLWQVTYTDNYGKLQTATGTATLVR